MFFLLAGIIFFFDGTVLNSQAQILNTRFGKNKVHYKVFKWATLDTAHFRIHFYRGEELLARNTEQLAERAYHYLSAALNYDFQEKIPLVIYASSDDFQQTEIIAGFLDEGIGGVTESLKGRIVIPFLGSYRSFNHVIVHELVHAFQFEILSGGGGSISALYLPLWFVEGMAEFLTEYSNPLTDMWLQDAVEHETLPEAKQIESMRDIRVYRFGESIWQHMNKLYGQGIVAKLLQGMSENRWEEVIRQHTERSWKENYDSWLESVRRTHTSDLSAQTPVGELGKRLIVHEENKSSLNIIPAISPNGKYVAFISDRDLYRTIYLASAEDGRIINKLVEGERLGTFETLRFLNTSLTWDPDSRHVAFNAKAGGENAIYVLDIHSRKVTEKFVPPVSSLSFMAWSPDGTMIAFTATKQGQEDLFVVDTTTREVFQLTDDLYSNRHPAWSPDSKTIAFSTDAGLYSKPEELKFGPSNLALYQISDGDSYLLTETPANDFTPAWSPDGTLLAFISDRRGLCNLYLMELREHADKTRRFSVKSTRAISNVTSGIVGLTEDNPALSWAKDSGRLVFSAFSQRGWDIFSLERPDQNYRQYLAEVGFEEEIPPRQWEQVSTEMIGKKDWGTALLDEAEKGEIQEYSSRLSPEYLLFGGGGNLEDFVIVGRLGFGDLLSNRRLSILLNITEIFDESDFAISYTNRAQRLNYFVTLFQFGNNSGTFLMKDAMLDTSVQRGAGIYFRWPFDKFKRVELGLEGWMVEGAMEHDDTRQPVDDLFFAVPSLAYVHDTSFYSYLGPLDGIRAKLSLRPSIGDLSYVTLSADYRQYFHMTRRSALALRLLSVGSFGENARIFEFGGPLSFRGEGFEDTSDEEAKIRGTKMALGNLEYRFPLIPALDILRGNVFIDMAVGWDGEPLQTAEHTGQFRAEELRTAFGSGIRLPVNGPFGLVNLRFDLAWETDFNRIGPGNVLFSIANDF